MKQKKHILFPLLLLLATSPILSLIPALNPTQISQDIKETTASERGYFHYMKVSVNPERKKVAFSPDLLNLSAYSTGINKYLRVFEVQSDFTLSNKKEFTTGGSHFGTNSFFGTDVVAAFDDNSKSVKMLKIGESITQDGDDFTGFNTNERNQIITKKEKNIMVVNQKEYSGNTFQLIKLDGNTNPKFPASADYWQKALFGDTQSAFYFSVEFNPTPTSTELIVAGSNFLIIDVSKFSDNGQDLDSSSATKILFSTITDYFPSSGLVYSIVYHTMDTTKLLININTLTPKIIHFLNNQGTSFINLGFVDESVNSLTGLSRRKGLNIHNSGYFFLILTIKNYGSNIYDDKSTLILVDTSTIAADGKMDHKKVGDEVTPSGETSPFVTSMEYLDLEKGVIIFTGASDTTSTYKGWYRILKLGDDYLQKACHIDCETCNTKSHTPNPNDCLSCKDTSVKIYGTSGCKCHANCLSCSENGNEKKCTYCRTGFNLTDSDGDGVGECLSETTKGETELEKCDGGKVECFAGGIKEIILLLFIIRFFE